MICSEAVHTSRNEAKTAPVLNLLLPQKQKLLLLVNIKTQGSYHVPKKSGISVESQMEQFSGISVRPGL